LIELKHKLSIAIVSIGLQLLVFISVAYAPWSTLGTGYAVTSDYHGIDVIIGNPVNVTAGTLDPSIYQVTFKWNAPNGTEGVWIDVFTPLVTNGSKGRWGSSGVWVLIHYAWSVHTPDSIGDWGVKVLFQGPDGTTKENTDEVVSIKATSFNSVPEVPFGTLAILAAMFGAVTIFAIKRKRVSPPPIKRLLCI
jgi:hypothetical protein